MAAENCLAAGTLLNDRHQLAVQNLFFLSFITLFKQNILLERIAVIYFQSKTSV
jgi:hypothetical protein